MSQVDLLEAEPRVISNPFLEIPINPEAGGQLAPVSGNTGMTNRNFQDSYQPQNITPNAGSPVIDVEWEDVQPDSLESPAEYSERMRREWALEDEERIRRLEAEDRAYDLERERLESQYSPQRKRGSNPQTFGRAVAGFGGLIEGYGRYRANRDSGLGVGESVGEAAGATIGFAVGAEQAGRFAARATGAATATGVGAVASGAAVVGAAAAGGIAGGAVGGAIGGAIGKAIDDIWEQFNPAEEYTPADEIFGDDIPLDAPFGQPEGAPSRDPNDPNYNPDTDFDGGQCEVEYRVNFVGIRSDGSRFGVSSNVTGNGPIAGIAPDPGSRANFLILFEGGSNPTAVTTTAKPFGLTYTFTDLTISRTDGEPDDCGDLVPEFDPPPAPTKPAPYNPIDPRPFDQPATGSPFRDFPGFGSDPFPFLPRFRNPTSVPIEPFAGDKASLK